MRPRLCCSSQAPPSAHLGKPPGRTATRLAPVGDGADRLLGAFRLRTNLMAVRASTPYERLYVSEDKSQQTRATYFILTSPRVVDFRCAPSLPNSSSDSASLSASERARRRGDAPKLPLWATQKQIEFR
jgi:hypothetical protein